MNLTLPKRKLTLVLLLVLAGLFNSFAQFDSDSTVLIVAEDIFVSELEPDKNFNGVTDLGVTIDESNGNSREAYVTFDITGLYGLGKIGTANLNIMAAVKGDAGWIPVDEFVINVYAVNEPWNETTMTWVTKPKSEEEILAQVTVLPEALRHYIYGTEEDKTAIAKYIQKAIDEEKQTVSFVFKGAEDIGNSRAWISDKGWEAAKLTVVFEEYIIEHYVDKINVSGAGNATSITADNGSLQMNAEILPANADIKEVKWSVTDGTGKATISKTGLLTALTNGTVTVKADAIDGSYTQGTLDITISGQVLSEDDIFNNLNLIRNWNTTTDLSGWGGWVDGAVPGQVAPLIEEGVTVMKVGIATDNAPWHYQHNQNQLQAEPNVPYVFSFKSWASGDASAVVDFEDTDTNNYNRYGASSDPEAQNGRSEWHYNLTTEPKWFTFHVTFDQIVETTNQKVQFMLSISNETIYLDSVLLVKAADYELLTSHKTMENSVARVYPNPVGSSNVLYVDLTAVNSKVSIFNSSGQKIMEKTAEGNRVTFNVSSLPKGMYIIKNEDGSSQKFIR